MNIDVELLISSIQERSPLWNQSNEKYIHRIQCKRRQILLGSASHRFALPGSALVCNKPKGFQPI